ncbi:hypothetical protein TWF481_003719 [Arthrobotrys musiformis]|uniref:Uncharacterized protein n=1 Tax=Arthrobotrys musiformis TaxID=47236 RepID=A0AAV9WIB4_9PEZI
MFPGRPRYQTSSATENHDDEEDDDEVEGVEIPPPKEAKSKLPVNLGPAKTSTPGRLISTTLEHYWQKKPQRERTSTSAEPALNPTALSEAREHHKQQLPRREQQPVPRKTSARSSPASDYSVRRFSIQDAAAGGDEGGSQDDELVVIPKLKTKPGPRPSSLISHTHRHGMSPIKSSIKSSPTVSKPFSKRDLLRQFEDTDEDSDEVMLECGELSNEEGGNGDHDPDEMDQDLPQKAYEDEEIDEDEDEDDSGDELMGIGSRRVPVFSQDPPPQQLEISGTEEEESEDLEDSEESLRTPTKTGVLDVDLTPRRSMANPNLLEEDPDELEREEERARQKIVKGVLNRNAEVAAKNNFEVVVIMPNYEDVADHLFNPDEWEAVEIDWRWTRDDGNVTYQIIYRDGHTRVVEGNDILNHVEPQVLEDFENDLFKREENPETWYYPNLRAPGGAFAGGTGITSGAIKRRGRRTEAKIHLDNSFRLGMPEEFNIPLTDSSEDDDDDQSEEEDMEEIEAGEPSRDVAGVRGPILASQYDKFDITDADILATIRENESDNESWDGARSSGRGRPRGRPSTSTRAHTMIRPTRAAAKRARGRPPLTPTRGTSNPTKGPVVPIVKSNVVKASATSRGRGRPRGSKNIPRMDTSTSSREVTPPSLTIPAHVHIQPIRGRPRKLKAVSKPVISDSSDSESETSSPTSSPIVVRPIMPIRPLDLSKLPPPTLTRPTPSTPQRKVLKPTRAPKPPGTPSGARGPGRPPKVAKREEDLVEQTVRTTGTNIVHNSTPSSSHHRRTLSSTGQILAAEPEPPKKRRRIRFGRDGPEEASEGDLPRRKNVQANLSSPQIKPNKLVEKLQKPKKTPKPTKNSESDDEKSVFRHEVDRIINKMLLDGTPAYHVQLRGPGTVKPTMWVRLENLQSQDARRKVKEFEAELVHREHEARLARDRISAQLQRDRQRLAEREAQILGPAKGPGRPPKKIDEDERKEREKEEQRQREKIARRLAMQETLFAGT